MPNIERTIYLETDYDVAEIVYVQGTNYNPIILTMADATIPEGSAATYTVNYGSTGTWNTCEYANSVVTIKPRTGDFTKVGKAWLQVHIDSADTGASFRIPMRITPNDAFDDQSGDGGSVLAPLIERIEALENRSPNWVYNDGDLDIR